MSLLSSSHTISIPVFLNMAKTLLLSANVDMCDIELITQIMFLPDKYYKRFWIEMSYYLNTNQRMLKNYFYRFIAIRVMNQKDAHIDMLKKRNVESDSNSQNSIHLFSKNNSEQEPLDSDVLFCFPDPSFF
ncbi:Hypothetical_protein [Hexamita inflata]|uniref:Hypothetical_protein n=1 Tax=Hexamita inflata TaxID=28002 RepID=A0AA86NED1_9EUKA|nr:Hypothetical protein HINF_LOCUS5224 [Hexamita inflata]